jgi:hypothetical protein
MARSKHRRSPRNVSDRVLIFRVYRKLLHCKKLLGLCGILLNGFVWITYMSPWQRIQGEQHNDGN